jgi:hypothetical protein
MRFEVVPSALFAEAAEMHAMPAAVRELSGAAATSIAAGSAAAGGPGAGAGLEYFGTRLGAVLSMFEATVGGMGAAVDAAAARYEATDRSAIPGR